MQAIAARLGVPAHEQYVFGPRKNRYAVAVFVINEGERVRAQLREMSALADQIDIIVADGGSTDGSLAPDSLADFRVRALLVKRDAGRLSAQMRMAIAFALEEEYEGLVVIDGNGKDDVAAIPINICVCSRHTSASAKRRCRTRRSIAQANPRCDPSAKR